MFAVNGNQTVVNFEIRLFRDTNVYNSQVDQVPIGKSHEVGTLDSAYQENQPTITSVRSLRRTIDIDDFKDFEGADD